MNLKNIEDAKKNLPANSPKITIELLSSQIGIAREARDRIEREGIVVRDMRGSVMPHPAIKIEQDALKCVKLLLEKKKKGRSIR